MQLFCCLYMSRNAGKNNSLQVDADTSDVAILDGNLQRLVKIAEIIAETKTEPNSWS